MRFVHDKQVASLEAAGGADSVLLVMARQDRPFRELTIWGEPGTGRVVGDVAAARGFTYQVFFGATAQSAPVARVNDEIFFVYDPGDTVRIWPANEPTSNLHRLTRNQVRGFDVSVLLTNTAAAPLTITLEFLALTIENG